ncbi:hypothetical protein [Streptomyces pseudogriseolus]|uniref:hypothetical protein n=1 Tax=Streptomyces pseudogriseolus TaxID=36817 RepID=UPI003FA277F7
MARGHGRILTSIWDDTDFLALTERQQRLYLFLISQPNLNHAGLLDLTLRRWSRKARGLTSAELEKLLQDLEATRFIVVDDDTEELLIRSFVRNDGVWKQPKVMGAMVSGALEISSWRLRHALLAEVDRIPLDELSDEPGARGVSIRQQVAEHIATLRKAFGNPPTDPNRRGSGTPSATPSGTPSDTPSQPLAEGGPEASTRAHAPASRAHSPAPAPAPAPDHCPLPTARAGADDTEPAVVQTGERAIEDRMTDAFLERYRTGNAYKQRQVRKVIADALTNGTEPGELWKALERLGSLSKPVSAGTLQFAFSELRQAQQASNVIALPNGQQLTGTDAKVAGWMAIAEQLRQEGDLA